jgi:hypothetical protein
MKSVTQQPAVDSLSCARCSTLLEPVLLKDEELGFSHDAHACPACGNLALTLEQLDAYNELRRRHVLDELTAEAQDLDLGY